MISLIGIKEGNVKKIEGSPKSLKQLLQNTKYSINYYQREYMWQRKHIEELIDDLTSEFRNNGNSTHNRERVKDYGAYFMGSIVLAGRENAIIDGQQRLTSLTLLLMYLNNKIKAIGKSYSMIEQMIFSEAYGKDNFNINIEDRNKCMNAIFQNEPFDTDGANESVRNIYRRYNDICELFPIDIINDMLFLFCDWLAERVFFIEIVADTEQDAHKVFITMNDRGLSLTSTEMLKGYILSEISDDNVRENMNNLWKKCIMKLKTSDEKGDESFIKTWLRAQYAETIRETRAGAINKDFDIIGGPFHKWVRDKKMRLGLNTPQNYEQFLYRFEKFSNVYLMIREAEEKFSEETKYVFYNARLDFTLQPQLLLASIRFDDSRNIIIEKMNLVAIFIDLLIVSRAMTYKSLDYSTVKNYVFAVTKEIRNLDIPTLKNQLLIKSKELAFDPDASLMSFGLNAFTKRYIKHMLARITGHIEEKTGVASNYINYIDTETRNPFEIEHIISDHYEWFTDEYQDQEDFRIWRNKFGAMLLLHKSINASLSDKKFAEKLPKYCSNEGNILSETLGTLAYTNNPQFTSFMRAHELKFKPYESFGKNEIKERNLLLTQLIKQIWNEEPFN